MRRAFRCKSPGSKVDLALPHEVEDTAAGSDPLMAVREDGTRHPVEAVTVEMWRAKQASRHSKSGNELLWQGERLGTVHKLRIAQRTDRCLLLSLYEQSSQIANVRIDRWGGLARRTTMRCTEQHARSAGGARVLAPARD